MKIAFQTFNVASTWKTKRYDLDSNKTFKTMMENVRKKNDYVVLGLQEARREDFVREYQKTGLNVSWDRLKVPLRQNLGIGEKIVEGFTKTIGKYQNVQLYCFKKNNRSETVQFQTQFCKKRCGFRKSPFKGALILSFSINEIPVVVVNTHFTFKGKLSDFGLSYRIEEINALMNHLIEKFPDLKQRIVIMMGDLNFRFLREKLSHLNKQHALEKQELGVYLQKLQNRRQKNNECFDEMCKFLTEYVRKNDEKDAKTCVFKGFLDSLKQSRYPITCRFKNRTVNSEKLQSFPNLSLQKGGTTRDPSNCDKLVFYIPEDAKQKGVEFIYNKEKTIRIEGSDHLFMNHGSLVFNTTSEEATF